VALADTQKVVKMLPAAKNKLLFVRHGECVANLEQSFAGGDIDSPLTDKGRRDAARTAEELVAKGFTIDHVVSSPLSRAHDTAKIILDTLNLDLPIEIDDRIIERRIGRLSGQPMKEKFAMMKTADQEPTAETRQQLYDRVKLALADLKQHKGTTLIIAHNGVLKAIRCVEMGLPPEEMSNMPNLENGEIYEIDY
jgi:probable phosphoglycerate mutase